MRWEEQLWHNWETKYVTEDKALIMQISVETEAPNEDINNDCDALKEVANEYTLKQNNRLT